MPIGDYEIGARIAQTNMSEVWSGRRLIDGQEVALKRRPDTQRAERRFMREIEAQQHSAGTHTMPIIEYDPDYNWYVMPWASMTLAQLRVPNEQHIIPVVEAIADSLRPIHSRGQVHRDLKPENILWLTDHRPGRWVVGDFGIVRNAAGATTAPLTMAGGPLGSTGWMAPEQHDAAHDATPSTDVYAVGAIMSWLLTGSGPTPGHVDLPNRSSSYRMVVWKATQRRQLDRYEDLDSLRDAVLAASTSVESVLAELVAEKNFAELLTFAMNHPSRYTELAEELPSLNRSDVDRWDAENPMGLRDLTILVLEALVDEGIGEIVFSRLDRFLTWSIQAVQKQLDRDDLESAENVARALLRAISEVHQFAPAEDVLKWLDQLTVPAQRVMEDAMRMAEAWDFFERMASGRFQTSRTSPLVRRLSERKTR